MVLHSVAVSACTLVPTPPHNMCSRLDLVYVSGNKANKSYFFVNHTKYLSNFFGSLLSLKHQFSVTIPKHNHVWCVTSVFMLLQNITFTSSLGAKVNVIPPLLESIHTTVEPRLTTTPEEQPDAL